MFTVIIQDSFTASHSVPLPSGKLEEPHEHNWLVEIAVKTDNLDKDGFAVEFLSLKEQLARVLMPLKEKNLNEIEDFSTNLPTAERVIKYVHDGVKTNLPCGVEMDYALIEEAQGCYVKYTNR